MARIISVHSFRGGTGKSNTTANLSALFALQGKRVGVVDTDIQSPGIHVLFGLNEDSVPHVLNDYLWGRCDIEETACDVTKGLGTEVPGRVFLIPSSINAGDIARVLRDGYDMNLLSEGFHRLVRELSLDALVIDTHPGLNEETLLSIAISNTLLIVLRPDRQDYQGTAITLEVAKELDVPEILFLVNKVPSSFDEASIKTLVEDAYGCEVAAVLPHADELMTLASEDLFVLRYPDHPVAHALRRLAARLIP